MVRIINTNYLLCEKRNDFQRRDHLIYYLILYQLSDPSSLGVNVIMSVDVISFERPNHSSNILSIIINDVPPNNNISYVILKVSKQWIKI